jgi:hypothetical protein
MNTSKIKDKKKLTKTEKKKNASKPNPASIGGRGASRRAASGIAIAG